VVAGAIIEMAGFGSGQLIRLVANVVLTRLLFPEAFGLMSMMTVVLVGLTMLSDVGISQAVIRSPHGDDPRFLRTAWTMLVLRGIGLWLTASVLAWPLSRFFSEPQLLWILPVGSLVTVLQGFSSTRLFLMRRQVRSAPVVGLDLGSQVLAILITVLGARAGLGVAARVIGNLTSAAVRAAASHLLPGTHRDGFGIDPVARRQILDFGRWIFAASALTFLANRGDVFLLGRFIGAAGLGIYNLALALAEIPDAIGQRVIAGVLYPAFCRGHREHPADMPRTYYRTRLAFDAVVHTALGGLAGLAPWLIDLLYDDRYQAAKAMLPVLALRMALVLMAQPCESYLTSLGLSRFGFRRHLFVVATMLPAMPLGHWLGGTMGLLWASTLARISGLVALWPAARERGILRLHRELLVVVFLALGYGLARVLRWILPAV
jgi:O-antigen/teichoic acid export membrane protein